MFRRERVVLSVYLYDVLYREFKGVDRKKLRRLANRFLRLLVEEGVVVRRRVSKRVFEYVLVNPMALVDLIVNKVRPKLSNESRVCLSEGLNVDFALGLLVSGNVRAHALWWDLEGLRRRSSLSDKDVQVVVDYFSMYLEDISNRVLVFRDSDGEYRVVGYRSRFVSPSVARRILDGLRYAFEKGSGYGVGVFLTITLPPVFPLRIQNYILSFLLHRVKAFLRRRVRGEVPHVKVVEPHGDFRVHFHVVVFNVGFVMDKRELTRYLEKHLVSFLENFGHHYRATINRRASDFEVRALNEFGKKLLKRYFRYKAKHRGYEGPVNWVSRVRVVDGDWVFEVPPPERHRFADGGFRRVVDYLMFYVSKNLRFVYGSFGSGGSSGGSIASLAFYWFLRLPFFTMSNRLRPATSTRSSRLGWVFVGSFYVDELPDFVFDSSLVAP